VTSLNLFRQALWRRPALGLILPIALFSASPILAAEPNPGDACTTAGVYMQSGGPEVAGGGHFLVCDGAVWKSVVDYSATTGRVDVDIANDTGSCTAAKTGRLRYDDADDEWEYCDGSDPWKPLTAASSGIVCTPPPLCPDVGDVCGDGSLFAGFILYASSCEPLYVTDNNQSTSIAWRTAGSGNHITDPVDEYDAVDGRYNRDNRVVGSFPALELCENNTYHGKSDWYLPARAELHLLMLNRAAINANAAGNFTVDSYWASTEASSTGAWSQNFSDKGHQRTNKPTTLDVRCVRRD
jgi:hypothetical protein